MITEKIFNAENVTAISPQLAQLKQLFPNCFNPNGEFLFEKFQAEIALQTDISKEFYSMNWLGKSYAKLLRNLPPETLLTEDLEHNCKPENADSQNVLIQGDNLEVLQHLRNAYRNSVKMIYIDPPYNTGSDGFVYQDDRKFTPEQLANLANITQDEAERILNFTDKGSNSHSAWLTFMYPRLYIARELLKENGVIFISIGDDEVAQLKLLCDEILGNENFIAQLGWEKKKKPSFLNKNLGSKLEYILCYAKDRSKTKAFSVDVTEEGKKYPLNNAGNSEANLVFPIGSVQFNLPDCVISAQDMSEDNIKTILLNDVIIKDGRNANEFTLFGEWRYSQKKLNEIISNKEKLTISKIPFRPNHHKTGGEIKKIHNLLTLNHYDIGANEDASAELLDLFGKDIFDYPKPTKLLTFLIKSVLYDSYNEIVMDFFAGSGTLAHSVMQYNEQNKNSSLQYICVQVLEDLDNSLLTVINQDAKKTIQKAIEFLDSINRPHNIFEITKERIIRSALKIREENPNASGDFGFKIYQTTENFNAVNDDEFNPNQAQLPNLTSLTESQIQTLLTTWRVYDGAKLTVPVQAVDLDSYTAYLCDKRLYLLNEHFDSQHLLAFIHKLDNDTAFNPNRVIVFGSHMASAMQQELNQALASYNNRKNINLSLIVRN